MQMSRSIAQIIFRRLKNAQIDCNFSYFLHLLQSSSFSYGSTVLKRTLASSRIDLHPSLSSDFALQSLIPNYSKSSLTALHHRFLGLPLALLLAMLFLKTFLHGLLSSILLMCPSHLGLPILTKETISMSSQSWQTSTFYFLFFIFL